MKATISLTLLALLAFNLAGCSPRAQRVSILANRWEIGEHKSCTFLELDGLVCDAGPVPTTYFEAAQTRKSLSESVVVEKADYDASFSVPTSEYSLWDCVKTGTSRIAIACTLIHQPSANESAILKAEEDYRAELSMASTTYGISLQNCLNAVVAEASTAEECGLKANETYKQTVDSTIGQMNGLADENTDRFTRIDGLIGEAKKLQQFLEKQIIEDSEQAKTQAAQRVRTAQRARVEPEVQFCEGKGPSSVSSPKDIRYCWYPDDDSGPFGPFSSRELAIGYAIDHYNEHSKVH